MNIQRSERLILVAPISAPQDRNSFVSHERRMVTCSPEEVPNRSQQAWTDGFFPVVVFQHADEIDLWTHEIPLIHRRWAAFGRDWEPERFEWLCHHPSIEVLRGLAQRDLLALPDQRFDQALQEWVEQDAEAKALLDQLQKGRLDPSELEVTAKPNSRGSVTRWVVRWLLDPRATLTLLWNRKTGDLRIKARAQETPMPQCLGGPNHVQSFGERGCLQLNPRNQEQGDLIRTLVQALALPEAIAQAASTESESGQVHWDLPSFRSVVDALLDYLAPAPAPAYRASDRLGNAPLRPWPERVPPLPEGLPWMLRTIEADPEGDLIILVFHFPQDSPPARPPEVSLYLDGHQAMLDEYAPYQPKTRRLEVHFIGALPGKDFAVRLEAPHPGHLVLRLFALPEGVQQ